MLDAFGSSDIGRVRARNEDSFVVRDDIGLYAVADGMGGHVAGDVASRTALAACAGALDHAARDEMAVRTAISAANAAVWQRAQTETDKAGMGTTLTLLFFTADLSEFLVGHVGDSRLYRMRGEELRQLTHDHTAAQELVDNGQLSRNAARRHPLSSMLYRSVGTRPDLDVDVNRFRSEKGDRFLLCSDGLSGMLADDDLAAILRQQLPPREICARLIDAANLHGGADNITAVIVDVGK